MATNDDDEMEYSNQKKNPQESAAAAGGNLGRGGIVFIPSLYDFDARRQSDFSFFAFILLPWSSFSFRRTSLCLRMSGHIFSLVLCFPFPFYFSCPALIMILKFTPVSYVNPGQH